MCELPRCPSLPALPLVCTIKVCILNKSRCCQHTLCFRVKSPGRLGGWRVGCIWRVCKVACTYNESMLTTHCDDCPVDDPQQRHHNVLNVFKGFPLRKTETESREKENGGKEVGEKKTEINKKWETQKYTHRCKTAPVLLKQPTTMGQTHNSGIMLALLPETLHNFFSTKLWRLVRFCLCGSKFAQSKFSLVLWTDGRLIKWNKKENNVFWLWSLKSVHFSRKRASWVPLVDHPQHGHLNRKRLLRRKCGFFCADLLSYSYRSLPFEATFLLCFSSSLCPEGNKGDEMYLTVCLSLCSDFSWVKLVLLLN